MQYKKCTYKFIKNVWSPIIFSQIMGNCRLSCKNLEHAGEFEELKCSNSKDFDISPSISQKSKAKPPIPLSCCGLIRESIEPGPSARKIDPLNPNLKQANESKSKSSTIANLLDLYSQLSPIVKAKFDELGALKYPPNSESFANISNEAITELPDNSLYEGQWHDEKRHGKGKLLWTDGSFFEGQWVNDKANGYGRLIHFDGDVYEGQWKDDQANGFGIYIHNAGGKYEGDWVNDKQHGYGREIWPDGTEYKGEFVNGIKQGKGVFTWSNGCIYEGDFIHNNIEGYGTHKWKDGRQYKGQWKNNKMNGRGIFTWPDGRFYEGHYKDDKKSGYGIYIWNDGKKYSGEWLDGRQNGFGIIYLSNGEKYEGIWKDGRPEQKIGELCENQVIDEVGSNELKQN